MNPYAWPTNWREDTRYRNLHSALTTLHGPERTARIVAGVDEPTNRDLAAWRGLGRRE